MSVFHLDAGADWFADAARGVSDADVYALYAELGDAEDELESKGVRRVRTAAGARHYGLPVGSIIKPDVPDAPKPRRAKPAPELDPDAFFKRPRTNPEWQGRVRRRVEILYPEEGDPEPEYSVQEMLSDAPLAQAIATRDEAQEALKTLQVLVDQARGWTRITEDALTDLIEGDGRLKTQYETGSSSAFFGPEFRRAAEQVLFGIDPSEPAERAPVYGYLSSYDHGNLDEFNAASQALNQYGDIAVRFKEDVDQRTTFTLGDSLDASNVAIQDGPAQIRLEMAGYPRSEFMHDFQLQRARGQLGTDAFVTPLPLREPLPLEAIDGRAEEIMYADGMDTDDIETEQGFVEVQVHGGVSLADIDRVSFSANTYGVLNDEGEPFGPGAVYEWYARVLTERGVEVWWVDEDGGQNRWAPPDPETKAVRRVRTPEGARAYGQPIGSIITGDVPVRASRDDNAYARALNALEEALREQDPPARLRDLHLEDLEAAAADPHGPNKDLVTIKLDTEVSMPLWVAQRLIRERGGRVPEVPVPPPLRLPTPVSELLPGMPVHVGDRVQRVDRVDRQGRVYLVGGGSVLLPGGRSATIDRAHERDVTPTPAPKPKDDPERTPKPRGGKGTGVDFEVDQYKLYRALLKVDPKMMVAAKGKTHALSKLVAERWTSLRQIGGALEEAERQGLVKLGRHKWTLAYHLRDLMGQGEDPKPRPKKPDAPKPPTPPAAPPAAERRGAPLLAFKRATSWDLNRPTGTRVWTPEGDKEIQTAEEAAYAHRLNTRDQMLFHYLTKGAGRHYYSHGKDAPVWDQVKQGVFNALPSGSAFKTVDEMPDEAVTAAFVEVMQKAFEAEHRKLNRKSSVPVASADLIPDDLRPRFDVLDERYGVDAVSRRDQTLGFAARFVLMKDRPSDAELAGYLQQEADLAKRQGQPPLDPPLTPADVRRALVETELRYRARFGFDPPLPENRVRPVLDLEGDKAGTKELKTWLSANGFTPKTLRTRGQTKRAYDQWMRDVGRPFDLDYDAFNEKYGVQPLDARRVFGEALRGGLEPELVKEMGDAWDALRRDYPYAMSSMETLVVQKLGDNTYADYSSWIKRVRFNISFVQPQEKGVPQYNERGVLTGYKAEKAPAKIWGSTRSDARGGWHPPGTDSPASVLTHELGHHFHLSVMSQRQRNELAVRIAAVFQALDTSDHRKRNAPAYDGSTYTTYNGKQMTYEQAVHAHWAGLIGLQVSQYAKRNEKEFFAEAWAEFKHSKTPRPVAAALGKYMDEILKGVTTRDEFLAR